MKRGFGLSRRGKGRVFWEWQRRIELIGTPRRCHGAACGALLRVRLAREGVSTLLVDGLYTATDDSAKGLKGVHHPVTDCKPAGTPHLRARSVLSGFRAQ